MKEKITVAVLFGGQSSEHEVSCVSAQTVISAMDTDKYNPVLIGITKQGHWVYVKYLEDIASGKWRESQVPVVLSPDATEKSLILFPQNDVERIHIDVAFPVLHGMYGEDGTIQGLFELAGIPYVGCGVFASAASMDKVYTKVLVNDLGIRQAEFVLITKHEIADMPACINKVEAKLQYPVFVKPSKAGSSCGVSKAEDAQSLEKALLLAVEHDWKILVEECITGREVECAVLGGYTPEASDVGEVVAAESFYTYDAKYNNPDSKTELHPVLPSGKLEAIRESALKIFKAVDGYGLSRVDFFLEDGTNDVVFNEINTLPGFTSISMYPMLWGEKGLDHKELIDRLIQLAFQR